MLSSQDYYKYVTEKYFQLRDKYNFDFMEISPCSIQTKDDLIRFVKRIMSRLFNQEEVIFIENDNNQNVQFYANDKVVTFKMDSKHGHIEIDFFKVLDIIAAQFGNIIKKIHDEQIYVTGSEKNMKEAWTEGFPIQIDEVDFRHKNYNGKRFKKSEVRSKFILNHKVDPIQYEEVVLQGLNKFLKNRGKEIRYNDKQLKLYEINKGLVYFALNGSYCGDFRINDSNTVFRNCLLNQIFLIDYLKDDHKIIYTDREENEMDILSPFKDFILKFGKENTN